jgi:hypothetical protein
LRRYLVKIQSEIANDLTIHGDCFQVEAPPSVFSEQAYRALWFLRSDAIMRNAYF